MAKTLPIELTKHAMREFGSLQKKPRSPQQFESEIGRAPLKNQALLRRGGEMFQAKDFFHGDTVILWVTVFRFFALDIEVSHLT